MRKIMIGVLVCACALMVCVACNGEEGQSSSLATSTEQSSIAVSSKEEISSSEDNTSNVGSSVDSSVSNSSEYSTSDSENGSSSVEDSSSAQTPTVRYYTVQFDTDGGTDIAAVQVKEGEKVVKPQDPTKSSSDGEYEFLGWYCGETEWDFNNTVTEDMTLTAKWKKVDGYTNPFLPKN